MNGLFGDRQAITCALGVHLVPPRVSLGLGLCPYISRGGDLHVFLACNVNIPDTYIFSLADSAARGTCS